MIFKKKQQHEPLDDFLAFSFAMLTKGAAHFLHPFHCPVLVTRDENRPDARTVILRSFSKPDRRLVCYCDARSSKAAQIRNNPHVAWVFYHPKKNFQLRIHGTATLCTDNAAAENEWKTMRPTSRINYSTTLAPGSLLRAPSSGLPEFISQKAPHLLDPSMGRENFAAIFCRFNAMDCLLLGLTGHKRACFSWEDDCLRASWVVP